LILVEDGCSEADALVADLRSRGRLASVRHVQVPKRGRAAAGNAGLAAAQGELIGFLDDDDLLYADHLEVLVAELARDDQSAGVYARAFEAPTQVVSEEPFRYEELSLVLSDSPEFSRDRMARGNFLPIQSVLFRRSCYQTHGGFDEDMESYEDWLLWVKYTANAPFRKVDKLTSLYRVPCEEEAFLRRWQTMMRDWPMARQRVFAAAPIRGADVETADSPPADPGPSLRRLRMARWSARYRSIGSLLAFWQRLVIFVALRLKRNAYVYEQVRGLYRKFRI